MRLLAVGETIPLNVLRFIPAQLGMRAEDRDGYAVREETRREHLAEIRRIYGYRMFPYVPSLGALRPGPDGYWANHFSPKDPTVSRATLIGLMEPEAF